MSPQAFENVIKQNVQVKDENKAHVLKIATLEHKKKIIISQLFAMAQSPLNTIKVHIKSK